MPSHLTVICISFFFIFANSVQRIGPVPNITFGDLFSVCFDLAHWIIFFAPTCKSQLGQDFGSKGCLRRFFCDFVQENGREFLVQHAYHVLIISLCYLATFTTQNKVWKCLDRLHDLGHALGLYKKQKIIFTKNDFVLHLTDCPLYCTVKLKIHFMDMKKSYDVLHGVDKKYRIKV